MTSHDDHVEKQAQALLALGLTREQGEFLPPSDEELAQLLDPVAKQHMDATRKAQIMDAIANDATTFARWTAAVEMAETLAIGAFAAQAETQAAPEQVKSRSAFAAIGEFFTDHLRAILATGGATAMAMGLAIVFLLPAGMDERVDQLYADYGSQWSERPQRLDVIRGADRGDGKTATALSASDQRILQGVNAGLASLGDDFRIRNLNTQSTTSTASLNAQERDAFFALGQLAALAHFKCALGAEEPFYTQSELMLQTLAEDLAAADDATSMAFRKVMQRQGNAETRVCRVGKAMIARVSK